jgi:hypothetical protein
MSLTPSSRSRLPIWWLWTAGKGTALLRLGKAAELNGLDESLKLLEIHIRVSFRAAAIFFFKRSLLDNYKIFPAAV